MKRKLILGILILICLGAVITFVKYKNSNKDVLLSTYKQLDDLEKKEITDYKKGKVSTIEIPSELVNENTFYYDTIYQNKEVYLVTFFTNNATTGNIEKLVDLESKKIVGYNLSD